MNRTVLVDRIKSVLETRLVEYPIDRIREANENLWAIGATREELASTTDAELANAIHQVIAARNSELNREDSERAMTIYFWHDNQAGQLRMSAISGMTDDLPFRSKIRLVSSVGPVVKAWREDPYVEGIPFEELRPVEFEHEEKDKATGFVLNVFYVFIGRSSVVPSRE
jgi:hypothetical protein